MLGFDRFGKMGVHADLQRALHVLVEGVGGQRDDGDGRGVGPAERPNGRRRFQAVHFRHADIHEDGVVVIDRALLEHLHRNSPVFRMIDLGFAHQDDLLYDFGVDHYVFRHEDVSALQFGALLFLEQAHVVLLGDSLEFVYHV